jgi:thioredoxin-related protein
MNLTLPIAIKIFFHIRRIEHSIRLLLFRMTTMNKKIYYTLFSISILLVWWLLFIDAKRPGYLGVLIGFAYTFYANIYFKNDENRVLKIIKYTLPFTYLIASLFFVSSIIFIIISPILIGFITLIISDLFKKEELKPIHFIIPLTFFYVYAFSVFPIWERTLYVHTTETYDFAEDSIIIKQTNLNEFQFLDVNFDTINLTTEKEYIIIETWNETCVPCIKAMTELPELYNKIDKRFDQYYLYEPNKNNKKVDYDKVFNFKKIKEKDKILLDLDKQFYTKLNIESYPYFLIYDKSGKCVYQQLGYNEGLRKELENAILDLQ